MEEEFLEKYKVEEAKKVRTKDVVSRQSGKKSEE